MTLPNEIYGLIGDIKEANKVKEILTYSIGQAMSSYPLKKNESISDKLFEEVLKKSGFDISGLKNDYSLFGKLTRRAHFSVKINVNTKDYGNQTIIFDVESLVGGFDANSPQYGTGYITYALDSKNSKKVPLQYASSVQSKGVITYASTSAFIEAMLVQKWPD